MGPVRRRISAAALALVPGPAAAETCATLRPRWSGEAPATALTEALHLATTPVTALLVVVTALALWRRSQWGALGATVGWSVYAGVLGFRTPPADGVAEGCVGSPALFIAVATAICMATILYTAPKARQ